jgi:hypothetical protein
MKFVRFEVRLDYLLTSHQEGWQINSLCNPAADVEPETQKNRGASFARQSPESHADRRDGS